VLALVPGLAALRPGSSLASPLLSRSAGLRVLRLGQGIGSAVRGSAIFLRLHGILRIDRRGLRAAMITMPMSTPTAMSPAVTRKSELPLAAGAPDALAAADGLATATADRVGDGNAVAVGSAVVGAAVVGAAVRDAVALAAIVGTAVVAAVGDAVAAVVVVGDGDVVLVPSGAQARESLTPGADAHTDRAGVTHELPSAAVRASDTRMNG